MTKNEKKRWGFSNIPAAVAVSGMHAEIAGTITQGHVVSACYMNMAWSLIEFPNHFHCFVYPKLSL
jgi:hypothetical protein